MRCKKNNSKYFWRDDTDAVTRLENFNSASGTTLQTLETFREQIMQLCVKIIDPQETMIYCTKLVVPYRWDISRLQRLVETLRVWTQVDTREEPCEDPKQVLNELFQQQNIL
ncbi:hypothetical protein Gasu2_67930 [Galdieria sulphuraria]|nr:hypothetical protein Gasu2_67930 [Galdieria sulphuraria]